MHGHVPSVSWDEVVDRLRTFERYPRLWPTAAANLRVVCLMRNDPQFAEVGRNVSHVSVVLWRCDRPNRITIVWSEPDSCFVIDRWLGLVLLGRIGSVVPEQDVIAMLMTHLAL